MPAYQFVFAIELADLAQRDRVFAALREMLERDVWQSYAAGVEAELADLLPGRDRHDSRRRHPSSGGGEA